MVKALLFVQGGHTDEDEPFSHSAHDGGLAVDGLCHGPDESGFAFPGEGLAAFGAEAAYPAAVVDLSERSEKGRSGVGRFADDAGEVFKGEDAKGAVPGISAELS